MACTAQDRATSRYTILARPLQSGHHGRVSCIGGSTSANSCSQLEHLNEAKSCNFPPCHFVVLEA